MLFRDRADAGIKLAHMLEQYRGQDCVVFALPRGGVPVAAKVAEYLDVPLDLLLVRKVGVPHQPEVAMGSVIDGGQPIVVRDERTMRLSGASEADFRRICADELREIERRRELYLGGRSPEPIEGRIAIVVDDGLATGNTMRAALHAVRRRHPARLIMAVPVAPAQTLSDLAGDVDAAVCVATPERFGAVGNFYQDFSQTTDGEVIALLRRKSHPEERSNV